MKGALTVPSPKAPTPPEKRFEYKRLDRDRVLVIAHRPGKKPLKTIVEVFHPDQLEELCGTPTPQGK